ncbi:hypothetical protein KX729_20270 [Rhizobium sp. XQZ8]|uniref:hypothetical protein n=1 Tax=Rhizobium populisoli TaxID=2859785 RepID=UPI001CA53C64|nr:hypothetical protein [Rhizobium populisoli]MBW6423800.1 hypothetical protein [Rhizobium populisoli]
MDEEFWKTVPSRQRAHGSGKTGALNIALLFGTAAIALSLIITPMLASRDDEGRRLANVQEDFDNLTTGSIPKHGEKGTKNYTIRRSVLQETPGAVCIVQGYGVGNDC